MWAHRSRQTCSKTRSNFMTSSSKLSLSAGFRVWVNQLGCLERNSGGASTELYFESKVKYADLIHFSATRPWFCHAQPLPDRALASAPLRALFTSVRLRSLFLSRRCEDVYRWGDLCHPCRPCPRFFKELKYTDKRSKAHA